MHTDMQSKYHADGRQPFLDAPKPDEDVGVEWRRKRSLPLSSRSRGKERSCKHTVSYNEDTKEEEEEED
jgi:hypothetical protein